MQPEAPALQVTAKMIEAFELADSGEAKSAVARRLGLARSTLYRWLDDPAARAAVEARRAEVAAEQRRSRQDRAVEMLAKGDRIGDIAAALGVDRRTLWKWAQQPEFAAEVRGARDTVTNVAGLSLAEAAVDAVRVLVAIMNDEKAPARERRQAAEAVLTRAFGHSGEAAVGTQRVPPRAVVDESLASRSDLDALSPGAIRKIARVLLEDEARRKYGDEAWGVDDEDDEEGCRPI